MSPAPNIPEMLNGQHTVPVAGEILAVRSASTTSTCGTLATLSAGVEAPASLNGGQSVPSQIYHLAV